MYKKLLNQFEGERSFVAGMALDSVINEWLEEFAEFLEEHAVPRQGTKKMECIEHGRMEIVIERSGGETIVLECGCAYRIDLDGCARVSTVRPGDGRWYPDKYVTEAEFRLRTLQEFYDLVSARGEEGEKGAWIPPLPLSVRNALAVCREKLSRLNPPPHPTEKGE